MSKRIKVNTWFKNQAHIDRELLEQALRSDARRREAARSKARRIVERLRAWGVSEELCYSIEEQLTDDFAATARVRFGDGVDETPVFMRKQCD